MFSRRGKQASGQRALLPGEPPVVQLEDAVLRHRLSA